LSVPGLAHWNDVVRRVDEPALEYFHLKAITIQNKVAKPSILARLANQLELSDVRGDSLNNTCSACSESRFLPELVLCFTGLPTS
jgi:hypothetical protein